MIADAIKNSTILACDDGGTILKLVHDELGIAGDLGPGRALVSLVDSGNFGKVLSFLLDLKERGVAYGWEVNAWIADQFITLDFSGVVVNDTLVVFISKAGIGGQESQELAMVQNRLDSAVYDEISRLNNDLINLQRELAKKNVQLERSNAALQKSKEDLRYLTSQIISAQENERLHIFTELHEGLAQAMVTLKLHLRTIQKRFSEMPEYLQDDFDAAQNLLIGMVEEIRCVSEELIPVLLKHIGFTASLKSLFGELCHDQNVKIELSVDNIDNLFSSQTEINLYRIFKEILNNIDTHSKANQVSISIKRQKSSVTFIIKDNGVGFDFQQVSDKRLADRGMGLAMVAERLRMIGADLNITSRPGMGTEISFSVTSDTN